MSAINSIEHEGFFYVETTDGIFGKGCRRCGGTGHYSHNGYDSICYLCGNVWEGRLGDVFDTREQAEKWCHERAVRKAQADRKREAARMVEVHALEAKVASVPADVRDFLLSIDLGYDQTEKSSFIISMAEELQFVTKARRAFTEKMVAAVRKTMEQRAGQAAEQAAHPAPSGRVAVTGEIASTKVVEGDYGTAYKVLVKSDEGFKVWVSLPKAQAEEAIRQFEDLPEWDPYTFGSACWFLGVETGSGFSYPGIKGRRITFTATLEPSRDDVSFAFGSRPTKGAWL